VPPETVQLVECHGTGTALGDAVEMETIHRFFGAARPGTIGIGSAKSMIGHALAAASGAALLKVTLGLHRKILPPTAKVRRPHAALRLGEGPFYLVQKAAPWPENHGAPRRAAINAFGFGGTNV